MPVRAAGSRLATRHATVGSHHWKRGKSGSGRRWRAGAFEIVAELREGELKRADKIAFIPDLQGVEPPDFSTGASEIALM
ncbi:MAG: hypothetical protein ACXWJL_01645 [Xanthobacteraceae bacterium]